MSQGTLTVIGTLICVAIFAINVTLGQLNEAELIRTHKVLTIDEVAKLYAAIQWNAKAILLAFGGALLMGFFAFTERNS